MSGFFMKELNLSACMFVFVLMMLFVFVVVALCCDIFDGSGPVSRAVEAASKQ